MLIPFTEYVRPDGRQREQFLEVEGEVGRRAQEVIRLGGRFEAELLINVVAITVAALVDGEQQDVAIELCDNGPGPEGIDGKFPALVDSALAALRRG